MRGKQCTLCQKEIQHVWPLGRCRGCDERERSRGKLTEISLRFNGRGEIPRLILDAYLGRLKRQKKIKLADLACAARFSDRLSREPSLEIRSWSEAIQVSKKLGIYSKQKLKTDPVFEVAKELEKSGKIPALCVRAIRLNGIMEGLKPSTRTLLERYFRETSQTDEPLRSKILMAYRVRDYERYLKDKDLFQPDLGIARGYFRTLQAAKGRGAYTHLLYLRRFFEWSVDTKLTRVNPYDGWLPEQSLTITCETCGKVSHSTSHSRLCKPCDEAQTTLRSHEELTRLVQSFRPPSPYHQYCLDLYVKYLKRYEVDPRHRLATRALMTWLGSRPLPTIRSWNQLLLLHDFPLTYKISRFHRLEPFNSA